MTITLPQTTTQSPPQRLSIAQVLFLHLVPGIVITVVFILLARLTTPLGWPSSLALLLTWPLVGIPVLLAILFYKGRQLNGKPSLEGILLYRQPLPKRQYLWLVPVLLVWAAAASTLLFPLGEAIHLSLFAAWPDWLNLTSLAQNPTQYSTGVLWVVVALSAVMNIAVPITEELYFRSFLLPRLPFSPRWSPLISAVLFSLYHFWLPWDIIGRIITLLPIVYAVQWKRNVYLSIFVHCLLNLLGTVGLAAVVAGAV